MPRCVGSPRPNSCLELTGRDRLSSFQCRPEGFRCSREECNSASYAAGGQTDALGGPGERG